MRFYHRLPGLFGSQPKLTGKIARGCIVMFDILRPSKPVIDAFLALTDLTGAVSAAALMPTLPGA